jgi:hypothetical protein
MATINVADKTYVDAAIGSMVVSAAVNGSGHLILTRQNGSTFDAGDFSTAITNLINTVLASTTLLNILIGSSAVGNVALKTKGYVGQTADLQQWLNSASAVLAKMDKDGKFTAAAIVNTAIDGALNTLTNVNASEIDSSKVTVNTTAPTTPATGDIWINPSGT